MYIDDVLFVDNIRFVMFWIIVYKYGVFLEIKYCYECVFKKVMNMIWIVI